MYGTKMFIEKCTTMYIENKYDTIKVNIQNLCTTLLNSDIQGPCSHFPILRSLFLFNQRVANELEK